MSTRVRWPVLLISAVLASPRRRRRPARLTWMLAIRAQQAQIRAEVDARYATLDECKRQGLVEQNVVARLLGGKSRTICRRHKPIGSNRPTTVCKTVAQLAAEGRAADQDHAKRDLTCSEAMMGPGGCQR